MRALLAVLAVSCVNAAARAADADHPVVIELFQSQGCSSCPPANARVLALADRPDVLALSWQVTYWDYLGWTDSFGDRAFTRRQYDYARGLGRDGVFTPQVVVNGRVDTPGAGQGEIEALLPGADRGDSGPVLTLSAGMVHVGSGTGGGTVVLVRYDPRVLQVPVLRGENGGVTLPHRNVVRQVAELGQWTGQPASFALPPSSQAGLKTAILVQTMPGGAILAARRN